MRDADLTGLSPASVVVAAGRPPRTPGGPLNPPVDFDSTYVAGGELGYGRDGNPTWTAFEETLGALEGGDTLAFSSGLAAMNAVLDLVPPGGRIVAPLSAYLGTVASLERVADAGAARVDRVDTADTDAVIAALDADPAPDLLLLEDPSNPLLELADVQRLAHHARSRGALVAADNTFATPLLRRPLSSGAHLVVHSATKFLAGHSDVLLGAVVVAPDRRDLFDRLRRTRVLRGAVPGPMETWLALRGMRTLDVRLRRSCASAAELAVRLAGHPAVTRVRYPGFGGIVSIEVGDADRADRVCDGVRLWTNATSLGGVESLLERRRSHAEEPDGVPDDLIRLSVGIEDVEDLWRDLDAALSAAG